jgi:tol-pal system protein YbgF
LKKQRVCRCGPYFLVLVVLALNFGSCSKQVPYMDSSAAAREMDDPFYGRSSSKETFPKEQGGREPVYKGSQSSADTRLAELASQMEGMRFKLQALEGRMEEFQYQLRQLQEGEGGKKGQTQEKIANLERSLFALQDRLAQLESQGLATTPATSRTPEEPSSPSTSSSPASPTPKKSEPKAAAAKASPQELFQEGVGLYKKKDYAKAREKLSLYLQNNTQGPKAAEARYYLADAFYQDKQIDEAIVEFNKVIDSFPKSPLAAAALLKQAYGFKSQGKTKVYKLVLEKLVADYPQSPEAGQAKKLLTATSTSPKKEKRN